MSSYKNLLSTDSLSKLFSIPIKKPFELNVNLQIISFVEMQKKNIFNVIFSDGQRKYKNFVVKAEGEKNQVLRQGQIVNLSSVHMTLLKSEVNPIFVVGSYKIIHEEQELIGNPESFTDEEIGILMSTNRKESIVSVENEEKNEAKGIVNQSSTVEVNIETGNDKEKSTVFSQINYEKPSFPAVSSENITKREKILKIDEKSIENTYPLKSLNTFTKDLSILVRVIKIGELKKYTNSRGEGCLFTFIIMDKDGLEMQVSCFNRTAERLHQLIEINKIYYIKGGSVKINDRRFNNTKADFKIVVDEKTIIKETNDTGEIRLLSVDIVSLTSIINLSNGSFVDVIGVVVEVNELIHKATKNGDSLMRRIFIVDRSLYKIELSLWKSNATLPIKQNDLLLCKNLKIGDFNGKNLSTFDDSQIIINPKELGDEEYESMREYIKNYKGEYLTMTSSGMKTLVVSQNLNIKYMKEVLDSLNKYLNTQTICEEAPAVIKVTISNFHMTEKYVYAGCPDSNCKKKLSEGIQMKGYFCNMCNQKYSSPEYYYNIPIIIKDSSCEFWVDVFGGLGDKLIGISAKEYKKIIDDHNESMMFKIQSQVEYQSFVFQVKPRITNFSNVIRKKLQVTNIDSVNRGLDFNRMIREFNIL